MKKICLLFFAVSAWFCCAQENSLEHYQLKVYSAATALQMNKTDQYLKDVFIPKLKEKGIELVGVFKPKTLDSISSKKIYVLIPFNSLSEFTLLENYLQVEQHEIAKGKQYANFANKPSYSAIESVLLKAFIDIPYLKSQAYQKNKENRIYELGQYQTKTIKKLDKILLTDFISNKKIKLHDLTNFQEIFYGEVISEKSNTNLMYMATYNQKEQSNIGEITSDNANKNQQLQENKAKIALNSKITPKTVTNLLFAAEYSDF